MQFILFLSLLKWQHFYIGTLLGGITLFFLILAIRDTHFYKKDISCKVKNILHFSKEDLQKVGVSNTMEREMVKLSLKFRNYDSSFKAPIESIWVEVTQDGEICELASILNEVPWVTPINKGTSSEIEAFFWVDSGEILSVEVINIETKESIDYECFILEED